MKNRNFFFVLTMSFLIIKTLSVNSINPDYSENEDVLMSLLGMNYKSIQDRFEIAFSSNPEVIKEPVSDMVYGKYTLVRYLCETSDGMEGVSVSRYPDDFTQNHNESETVRGCIEGYEKGFGISVNSSDYTIDGKKGKLAKFTANGIYWVAGIVFKNGSLFQILMLKMDGYPSENEINIFIGTFKTF